MNENLTQRKKTLIGGQAIVEGVMMRGGTSFAMAVRNSNGEIRLHSRHLKKRKNFLFKVPFVRGILIFFSSMVLGIYCIFASANAQTDKKEEKISNTTIFFILIISLFFSIALFFLLPSLLASILLNLFNQNNNLWLLNIIEGLARVFIFLFYLICMRSLKDIRRFFMYHGAEHMTINCFEKGYKLTVENVSKQSTRHNRCGTTFLFWVIVISIFVFSIANVLLNNIYILNTWYGRIVIRIVVLPIVAAISYELLRLLALCHDNFLVRILRAPGLFLQSLTTMRPDEKIIETGIMSFKCVLKMDANKDSKEYNFDETLLKPFYDQFKHGFFNSDNQSDLDWIFCEVLDCKRNELNKINTLTQEQVNKIKYMIEKRQQNVPLAYILQKSNFCGYDFFINENVLIPRFETELLVEKGNQIINLEKKQNILDLCCGSGCIGITLYKQNNNIFCMFVDVSEEALKVCENNCKRYIEKQSSYLIKQSDMFDDISMKFDLIICNPPYIKESEINELEEEVKKEPFIALNGGKDGLKYYKILANESDKFLNKQGVLLLEIAIGQSNDIIKLFSKKFNIKFYKDLNNIDRIAECRLK